MIQKLRRLRQDKCLKFKVSMGYRRKPCLKSSQTARSTLDLEWEMERTKEH